MNEKSIMRKSLVFMIIVVLCGTCIIPGIARYTEKPLPVSQGTWLYVGGTGPGNYSRIQDAINNSQDGDTVFVYDDSSPYYESLIINTSITLRGENKNTTIIDGSNVTLTKMIDVTAPGCTLTELYIQNYHSNNTYGAVFIRNDEDEDRCSITHNVFRDISTTAVYLIATHALISNNTFLNNSACLLLYGGGYHTVEDNVLINNSQGIVMDLCHWNTVHGNTIVNSGTGAFIIMSHYNAFSENILDGNKYDGFDSIGSCKNTYSRNVISNSRYGILLQVSQKNIITENNFINNTNQAIITHVNLFGLVMSIYFKRNFARNASVFSLIGRNQWEANYWSDWETSSPRPINRVFYFWSLNFLTRITGKSYTIYLSQFDWHPAQEPYDI